MNLDLNSLTNAMISDNNIHAPKSGTVSADNYSQKADDGYVGAVQDILDGFGQIDEKYSFNYKDPTSNMPDSLNLEKLTYEMPDADELYKAALESLAANYTKGYSSAYSSASKNSMEANQRIQTENLSAMLKQLEIEKAAEDARKKGKNADIKQGLARSSITEGRKSAVNDAETSAKNDLEMQRAGRVGILNNRLNEISSQLLFTIDMLNQGRDEAARAKAADLVASAQKQLEAVAKYNNTVDEKEASYKLSLEKNMRELEASEVNRIAKLLAAQNEYGSDAISKIREQEKLEFIKSYMKNMNGVEARGLFGAMGGFAAELGSSSALLEQFINGLK